jgi:hypothetical protein
MLWHMQDCVRRMLVRDSSARATAAEVLKHDWIKENGVAADVEIEPEVSSWAAGCKPATIGSCALHRGMALCRTKQACSATHMTANLM